MKVAGRVENRTSTLREQAVRFAARSEPVAALTDIEKE